MPRPRIRRRSNPVRLAGPAQASLGRNVVDRVFGDTDPEKDAVELEPQAPHGDLRHLGHNEYAHGNKDEQYDERHEHMDSVREQPASSC